MSVISKRAFQEREIVQGIDEEIPYSFDTTPWGGSPTSPVATVWDVTTSPKTDVTATVLPGGAVVNGSRIELAAVKALTANHRYRLEVRWTVGSTKLEPYVYINAEL